MKVPPYLIQVIVGAIGGIILSQMVSFGWPSKLDPELSSHDQAICVALSGFALLMLANFVRQTGSKIDALEKELAQLKVGSPSKQGGSSL